MAIPIIYLTILLNILAALYWTVDSVPLEYCKAPLNTSDCGLPPTSVYSYFGSDPDGPMCKVAVWRGCSTDNMFFNERQCVKLCTTKEFKGDVENYRCDVPMNTHACNEKYERVFTFNSEKQACVEAEWRGCPTLNKYEDQRSCENTCLNSILHKNDKLLTLQSDRELQFLMEEMDESFNGSND